MSYQENTNYIKAIQHAIQSYQGFTITEKAYGLRNIHKWIGEQGNLDIFIKKFSEISLDINPFISEYKLA